MAGLAAEGKGGRGSVRCLCLGPMGGTAAGQRAMPRDTADWTPSLGQEDPLEERAWATHSSILAWEIPWTEEPGGLQSRGSQRVRHDLATK